MKTIKSALIAFATANLFVAPVFAQGPARFGGPLLEPGLRQKLERATGKTLQPVVVRSVRDAQLEYFAREDKLAEETAAKVAAITRLPGDRIPRTPRPGADPLFSEAAFLQKLELAAGKTLTADERGKVEAAFSELEKEQRANFDRYVRDLTSKVPRLTKSQAEEILSGLAPKDNVAPATSRPGVVPRR